MASRLSRLKAHVDEQAVDKKGRVRPHAVAAVLKKLAAKAGVSYPTIKKAYDGSEIRDSKARAIQAVLPDIELSVGWEKPKSASIDFNGMRGRSVLSPPVISLEEAKRRFKEKSHRVESPYCAGCFKTLSENKIPGLPQGRAMCRLQHGYVLHNNTITWPEDIPVQEPEAQSTKPVPAKRRAQKRARRS